MDKTPIKHPYPPGTLVRYDKTVDSPFGDWQSCGKGVTTQSIGRTKKGFNYYIKNEMGLLVVMSHLYVEPLKLA